MELATQAPRVRAFGDASTASGGEMPHGASVRGHVRCLPPPHGGKCACYEGRGTINGRRQSDAKANRNVVASSLETKTIVPSKVLCAESWCPASHRLVLDASTLRSTRSQCDSHLSLLCLFTPLSYVASLSRLEKRLGAATEAPQLLFRLKARRNCKSDAA